MSEKLFELGAFHESGHIIMAYLVGFKAQSVALSIDEPGVGCTKFDYGQDALLIASILNAINDGGFFNSLPIEIKKRSLLTATRISHTLLGGPLAEALYKVGIDFVGNLEIDMRGPDVVSVENADYFLSCIDKNHRSDFLSHLLMQMADLIKNDNFWNAIKHLSDAILKSPNKCLTQEEIEKSLEESGYIKFLSKKSA
jgi:hypothetical protein